jgi:carbohydrate-selective porin OprB
MPTWLPAKSGYVHLKNPRIHRLTEITPFYKAHVTPWITLQPDLQYIANPSGIYGDSLTVGLRYQVSF